MTAFKTTLFSGAALLALAAVSTSAQAVPYAYASNQITGLTVTRTGGAITPSSATTTISDFAVFDGSPSAGTQARGIVGQAISINQAFSGPGAAPSSGFGAVGAGNFTGTRSNASIGAGTAATGVAVNNVAEGYGNALGNSTANNNAAIVFTVVGTNEAVTLAFTNAVELRASTAALTNETATAAIQNVFSVTPENSSTPLASFTPTSINRQLSSAAGVPPANSFGPQSFTETFTSPILTAGVNYTISLTSSASQSIQPGIPTVVPPTPVPEPISLALLGTGLVGLGLTRRRKSV